MRAETRAGILDAEMRHRLRKRARAAALAVLWAIGVSGEESLPPADLGEWTIAILSDNCPDYTWGLAEEETRRAFAEIVRAHLDEMARTDAAERPEDRDRYNMAVAQEALCLLERHPERREELFRRIREGRLYISPFLCNSLWGFQSAEGFLRTLYPARRLEAEIGTRAEAAHHIELPSLPWGVATLLAGCGIRWLSIPFLDYDSTFRELRCPPVFRLEGPDGSSIGVILDRWASLKANYTQGAAVLRDPEGAAREWVARYRSLGDRYPLRTILASGTHGDIALESGAQARTFSEAIRRHNAGPPPRPGLASVVLPDFVRAVEEAEAKAPFLETLRGSFGHSWEAWPVSLAACAAAAREGERRFLAAEALLATASAADPELAGRTRAARERAEWCLAMLSDHAWNGASDANRAENARLRRSWSSELLRISADLEEAGWRSLGLEPRADRIALFNPLGSPRRALVRLDFPGGEEPRFPRGIPAQVASAGGRREVVFLAPEIPGYGFLEIELVREPAAADAPFREDGSRIEGPFWILAWDGTSSGIRSALHRPTAREVVAAGAGGGLPSSTYFDGEGHRFARAASELEALGPVFARVRIESEAAGIRSVLRATAYAEIDRLDFDLSIRKPVATVENRLEHAFPVAAPGSIVRIETTGAVVRPYRAPRGDLLPGADPRRFAVQGFVDASLPGGPGVTVAPLDAFLLRRDLGEIVFEPAGNDQNYREVTKDQDGVTEFRFRYSLRAHAGYGDGSEAFRFSREASSPLLVARGSLGARRPSRPPLAFASERALATAWKPADADAGRPGPREGCVLRLFEISGRTGPLDIEIPGFRRAFRTDLLERDLEELPVVGGKVTVELRARGLAALRLLR